MKVRLSRVAVLAGVARTAAKPLTYAPRMWLDLLSYKLTAYDRKQRDQNIYRLGLLLGNLKKVEDRVKGFVDEDSDEARLKLVAAMKAEFIFEDGHFGLPFQDYVWKAILKYNATQKPMNLSIK